MIFELRHSELNGSSFAVVPDDFYASEDHDTCPFELTRLLRAAFPERARDFCVCCFDGYENAVSL